MNKLWHDHYHAVRELEALMDEMGIKFHRMRVHPEYESKIPEESQRSEGGRNGINSK